MDQRGCSEPKNSSRIEISTRLLLMEPKTSHLIRGEIAANRLLSRGFVGFEGGCASSLA